MLNHGKSLLKATFFGAIITASQTSFAHSVILACEVPLTSQNNHIVRMQDDLAVKIGAQRFKIPKNPISTEIPTTVLPEELPVLVNVLKKLNLKENMIAGEVEMKTLGLQNVLAALRSLSPREEANVELLEDLLFESVQKLDLKDLATPTSASTGLVAALVKELSPEGEAHKRFGHFEAYSMMLALVGGLSDQTLAGEAIVDSVIHPLRQARRLARDWNYTPPRYNQKVQFRLMRAKFEAKFRFYTNS